MILPRTRKQDELYLKGYGKGLPSEDRVAKLLQLASALSARSLLDIGCGDGSVSLALKHVVGAKEVFGIEISPQGAREARDKGIVCYALNVDENPLPFEDNSIDAIHAGQIIEHLYDPDGLLDEIFRVLHPQGFALIDTPNLAWWVDRLSLLFGFQPFSTEASLRFGSAGKLFSSGTPGGGGHLRILTLKSFKQLLEMHSFRIRRMVGAGGGKHPSGLLHFPFESIYGTIDRLLCSIPSLCPHIVALVDKQSERH